MGRVADLERKVGALEECLDICDSHVHELLRAVNGVPTEWHARYFGLRTPEGLAKRVKRLEANLSELMGGPPHDFCEKCGRPIEKGAKNDG